MPKHLLKFSLVSLLCVAFARAPVFLFALYGADNIQPNAADWIYSRQLQLYVYLIRFSNIPQQERQTLREKSYAFFFEYWVLHRSKHACFTPVPTFEREFAVLVRNRVAPFIDPQDPLKIRRDYKDGTFVLKSLPAGLKESMVNESDRFPQVEGLPYQQLKQWKTYQALVASFTDFVDGAAKSP